MKERLTKQIFNDIFKLFIEIIRLLIYLIVNLPVSISKLVGAILSFIPSFILLIIIILPIKFLDTVFKSNIEKNFDDSFFARIIEKYYLMLGKILGKVEIDYYYAVTVKFYNLSIWKNLDPDNREENRFENLAKYIEQIFIIGGSSLIIGCILLSIVVLLVLIFSPNINW